MSDHHNAQERCKACGATGRIVLLGKSDHAKATRQGLKIKGKVRNGVTTHYIDCPKCEGKGKREYRRNTYKHYLGHDLTEGNAGSLQWGSAYRQFHEDIWRQVGEIIVPDGLFILNVSDHYRKGERQPVSKWHKDTILGMGGWRLESTKRVKTQRLRQGQNHEARPEFENVFAFRRAA